MPPARHDAFARRLQRTLDATGFASGRARTGTLAAHFGVSRETARKWLAGLALPELERLIELARRHRVSFEWLATGRGTMAGGGLSLRDTAPRYADADEARLLGLVGRLSRKQRRALLDLLEPS